MKNKGIFLVGFFLLLIVSLLFFVKNSIDEEISFVEISDKKITVEVARTFEERKIGLMNRESLCDDCGMLFVFEDSGVNDFWMKNTLIPLDMVFIDSNLNVVGVLRAQPCVEDPCPTYSIGRESKYVLEVNSGTFGEEDVGEMVIFLND